MQSLCRSKNESCADRARRTSRPTFSLLCTCLAIVAMPEPGCVIPISGAVSTANDGGAGKPPLNDDAGIPPNGDASNPPPGGYPFGVAGIGGVVPVGAWSSVTANLANMDSECGNMTSVSAKPDEDLLIAGIALKGLWASRDGGMSWQALGTGVGSAQITNRPMTVVFDPDPKNSMQFWEVGIYNAGGVYRTADDGATFTLLGDSHHDDLVSIDFTDPARKTLLAGGHEQQQTVQRSTDGGMTWTNVGSGLPSNSTCTLPLILDGQTHLVGCVSYTKGPDGVYRTANGGMTWTQVTSSGGAAPPLHASDGSIYWASRDGKGMTHGSIDGQTWTDVTGAGVIASLAPVELPDGRLAAIGPVYGAQYVLVSADQGATWHPVSPKLPYNDERGLVYSPQRNTFYIWHFTCGNGSVPVPPDAIMSFEVATDAGVP